MGFRNPVRFATDQQARDAAAAAQQAATDAATAATAAQKTGTDAATAAAAAQKAASDAAYLAANGIIPGSRLAADAFVGRTFTGSTFTGGTVQTATSGKRASMTGPGGFQLWAGYTQETPASAAAWVQTNADGTHIFSRGVDLTAPDVVAKLSVHDAELPAGGHIAALDFTDTNGLTRDLLTRVTSADRTANVVGYALARGASGVPAGIGLTLPALPVGALIVVELSTDFYVEGAGGAQNLVIGMDAAGADRVAGHGMSAPGNGQGSLNIVWTGSSRQTFQVNRTTPVTLTSSYVAGIGAGRCVLQREDWTAWF